eukprot:3839863-Amphidinium_carterae.1
MQNQPQQCYELKWKSLQLEAEERLNVVRKAIMEKILRNDNFRALCHKSNKLQRHIHKGAMQSKCGFSV